MAWSKVLHLMIILSNQCFMPKFVKVKKNSLQGGSFGNLSLGPICPQKHDKKNQPCPSYDNEDDDVCVFYKEVLGGQFYVMRD